MWFSCFISEFIFKAHKLNVSFFFDYVFAAGSRRVRAPLPHKVRTTQLDSVSVFFLCARNQFQQVPVQSFQTHSAVFVGGKPKWNSVPLARGLESEASVRVSLPNSWRWRDEGLGQILVHAKFRPANRQPAGHTTLFVVFLSSPVFAAAW